MYDGQMCWLRMSKWMDGQTNEWMNDWMTPFLNIELHGGGVEYDCQVCYWLPPPTYG